MGQRGQLAYRITDHIWSSSKGAGSPRTLEPYGSENCWSANPMLCLLTRPATGWSTIVDHA